MCVFVVCFNNVLYLSILYTVYVCSYEANSSQLWLTYCWPSLYAAITSKHRFVLLKLIHLILILFCSYYYACF